MQRPSIFNLQQPAPTPAGKVWTSSQGNVPQLRCRVHEDDRPKRPSITRQVQATTQHISWKPHSYSSSSDIASKMGMGTRSFLHLARPCTEERWWYFELRFAFF